MAQIVTPVFYGVDVCKDHLDTAATHETKTVQLKNQSKAFESWLRSLPKHAVIGIEATSSFHIDFVEAAYRFGLTVYVVDGYRINKYRESVGGRAKTDITDAKLIARYVQREHEDLHAYVPLPPQQRQFWQLLKRRAAVVNHTKALKQSLKGLSGMKASVQAAINHLKHLTLLIEKQLLRIAKSLRWMADITRLQTIFGVGSLSAMALVATYHKVPFPNADAFVAFLGLDVRVRDSGKTKGKRKLTKKGDSECRRILFNAARSAASGEAMKPYYDQLIARGFASTQATVAIMRKLVRIAFAMLRDQVDYQSPVSQNV